MSEIQNQIKALMDKLALSAAKHPNNFQYSFTVGQVFLLWAEYFDNAKFVQAERTLQNAARISPRRQAAYLMLGKLKLQKNDFAGALEVVEQAINLDEQASDPHWFLGLIKITAGNEEEAVKEFARARELGYRFQPQELGYWININRQLGHEDENKELEALLEEKIKEQEALAKKVNK